MKLFNTVQMKSGVVQFGPLCRLHPGCQLAF